MSTRWRLVLGAPTIMADHALIAFGKLLFLFAGKGSKDHGIPAPMVNHKVGSKRRLPHPFPVLFPCYLGASFIRSDPIQGASMTCCLIVWMIPVACRCMCASLLAMVPSEMANPGRSWVI